MTVLDLARKWAAPPRILIVEDDPETVKALRDTLARYECETRFVTNAVDAINAVFSDTYDLVLIDLSLQDGSGADVVKALKTEHPSTPVLLVLGTEKGWLEEALTCGAVTVLRRPFDLNPQQLRQTLEMFKLRVVPRVGSRNGLAMATA